MINQALNSDIKAEQKINEVFSQEKNASERTKETNEQVFENTVELKDLHKNPESGTDNKLSFLDKIHHFFEHGPDWFQNFRNYFVLALNGVGIGLNTFSVIATNSNFLKEEVADFFDNLAEGYSRYVVPLGFTWNGIESLVGKRPLEALARVIPVAGFLTLPFYNFNIATGVSSAMTYWLGKVVARHDGKQPGQGDAWKNTTETLKTVKDITLDTFKSNSPETFIDKVGQYGLLFGGLGALIFAPHERDSKFARFFGTIRNIGGLAGDAELILNKHQDWRALYERAVGTSCSTASILNMVARFVNPKIARSLNHLAIAADDFGLSMWAQMSKKFNDAAMGKKMNSKKETKPSPNIAKELAQKDETSPQPVKQDTIETSKKEATANNYELAA